MNNLKIGEIVSGEITGVRPYGVFVKIDNTDIQGLIHISECKQGYVADINQLFHLGQKIKVIILDIDEYTNQVSLSLRALETTYYDEHNYHKKRYWTNYKNKIGFSTIADMTDFWIHEFLENQK